MDINYNIVSLIDLLGVIQGILFGVLLIFGSRKSRPSLLLGLFLITYSIEVVDAILMDTNIIQQQPSLLFLPFNFYLLSVPLFYLYAKSLIRSISLKKHLPILLPGIIEFLIYCILFLLPVSQKLQLIETPSYEIWYNIYSYSSLIYSIFFAIKTIQLVNLHQKKILNYFSNTEKRQLKWVKAIAIFILAFYSLWFIPLFLPEAIYGKYIYPAYGAINVFFIYWVGISGLRQPKIVMNIEDQKEASPPKNEILPSSKEKETTEIYEQLIEWMEKEQLFKEPDLTLPNLAEKLKITRRSLSQLINQKTNTNFNRFINQYRIEAAKKILADSKFDHLNMLGVAFEVGFNSKATFFSVFKQIEGASPGAYKKRQFVQQ